MSELHIFGAPLVLRKKGTARFATTAPKKATGGVTPVAALPKKHRAVIFVTKLQQSPALVWGAIRPRKN
jgi:hypothetical protein